MFQEMMAVVSLANANNRLVVGYQVEIDEQFKTRQASTLGPVPLNLNEAQTGTGLLTR